jgi:metal-dependent hydrolase (beta-lactamase superfamily II)
MIITTLIENTQADDKDSLTAEHGLSLHISLTYSKRILQDLDASRNLNTYVHFPADE